MLKENADWTISNAITFLGKFLTNHLIFYRNHNQLYILRLKLLKAGKTLAHYRIYMKYNGKFLTESFQIDYRNLSYEKQTCLILTFVRKSYGLKLQESSC